jgi:hypothetical protein
VNARLACRSGSRRLLKKRRRAVSSSMHNSGAAVKLIVEPQLVIEPVVR